jgi:hypothetical protein
MTIRYKEFCQSVYFFALDSCNYTASTEYQNLFNTDCYVLFNPTTKARAEWLFFIELIGWKMMTRIAYYLLRQTGWPAILLSGDEQ